MENLEKLRFKKIVPDFVYGLFYDFILEYDIGNRANRMFN